MQREPLDAGGRRTGPSRGLGAQGVCAAHPLPMGLQVDGVSYLLQEIYGIENKYNTQDSKVGAAPPACIPGPSHIPLPLPSTGLATETRSGQEFAAQHRAGAGWGHFVLASKLLEAENGRIQLFTPSFEVP